MMGMSPESLCGLKLISYEMLAIIWAIIGCAICTGVVCYNEGLRKGKGL